jgi:hypothetical protein
MKKGLIVVLFAVFCQQLYFTLTAYDIPLDISKFSHNNFTIIEVIIK